MALDYLTLEPAIPATAAIIWMHGLGASGYDFYTANLPQQLGLEEAIPVRFIFPHAPMRPVSINNGYVMRAWYDIHGLSRLDREDEQGLRETQVAIDELIQAQIQQGIPSERIFLAGFSQGGATALYCGLRYPKTLGGILALSSYLPAAASLAEQKNSANQNIAIFMAHGEHDPVVVPAWGIESRDFLLSLGYHVDWHLYPMEHELCLEELQDMKKWLLRCLI
ncbi:MAG TPA: alpha/beta hydrolase-fold protein [Coxiellaceae bacterium]|nr:alpha/beta hydrolase-fold protein [Coxiellaceae bacterium]